MDHQTKRTLCFLVGLLPTLTSAQGLDSTLTQKQWGASWIAAPRTKPTEYGVYYFRKIVALTTLPQSYPVLVSADNRYKLYVNEKLVSMGPARGDLLHWNYETVDLAPYLRTGKNLVAAQVWNEGETRPIANISLRTAFILQGGNEAAKELNTNKSWKCIQDQAYSPISVKIPTFYVAGPGERIDMNKAIRDWEKLSLDDSQWPQPETVGAGYPKNKTGYGGPTGWLLMPSPLPQMELTPQRFDAVRKAEGIPVLASFPATKTAITIPARTRVTLLLDQSVLTNAFPMLRFSGGKNSSLALGYAEALFTKFPNKGNRNEIEGKTVVGRIDSLISSGAANQTFTTLAWRTFRYLQLSIQTQDTPLVLDDIYSTFTGFPFTLRAKLYTDTTELQNMMAIGWRTARLCATETYMDCPYYEQLQYIGDTRIQALVSLYNSGDDRLVRNALNQIDYSRQPEGLTMSRYPSAAPQYITPFSLWYIGMLHDYLMYGKDPAFVKNKLNSSRQILTYFSTFQQPNGSLKNLPWWNFTDWVTTSNWPFGTRTPGKDGSSAPLDFQLLWAYQLAADLESNVGMADFATLYQQKAAQLKSTILTNYWDNTKRLFADRSEKDLFSQHANSLAILTGVVSGREANEVAQKLLSDSTLAPASIYFKYYLHLALTKAGYGDSYLSWLDKWRENMRMGLTTWGETSDVSTTRSDCHAWGASPNIEFFRTLLGIDSDAPAFQVVRIEPHLGNLQKIGGEMPHPNGIIRAQYEQQRGTVLAAIELPAGITGHLIWQGKQYALTAGKNNLKLSKK